PGPSPVPARVSVTPRFPMPYAGKARRAAAVSMRGKCDAAGDKGLQLDGARPVAVRARRDLVGHPAAEVERHRPGAVDELHQRPLAVAAQAARNRGGDLTGAPAARDATGRREAGVQALEPGRAGAVASGLAQQLSDRVAADVRDPRVRPLLQL